MVHAGIKEAHPAGIWSDLSVDGPVIGTLIVVLDKAKNLPNRKKIGKQDPYAVARLAKEAKRTDADVRGGQTPRWDKELRFPVRNSPDYRSLKISVFNDDKKTELIGETNVRLDKILVSGGGTDDGWRGLKCKDKYAGEILVELTFWDMRPAKEEAAALAAAEEIRAKEEAEADMMAARESPRKLGGAREMGGTREKTVKRRPLPADPMVREFPRELPSEPIPVKTSQQLVHGTRRSRDSQYDVHRSRHHQSSEQLPLQIEAPQNHRHREREYRSSRHGNGESSRTMIVAQSQSNYYRQNGQFDDQSPVDNFIPGGDTFGQFDGFEDDSYAQRQLPPPPPAHGRLNQGNTDLAMRRSPVPDHNNALTTQSSHERQLAKQRSMHRQSIPDWQYQEQQNALDHYQRREQDYEQRNNRDSQYQYGGSYPGPQTQLTLHEYDDSYGSTANLRSSKHKRRSYHGGYDGGMNYDDDVPGLSQGPTPSSSVNSRLELGPPPPPPPHRQSPSPAKYEMDVLNWQVQSNHQQQAYGNVGLPNYDAIQRDRSYDMPSDNNNYLLEARRPSPGLDMGPTRNGMPIPPSLVPGIDPAVASDLSERIDNERRHEAAHMPVKPLQIEPPPSRQAQRNSPSPAVASNNYHRPQVEEVQDVQLYQSQMLPEDIERPLKVRKQHRSAPMVKPTPIHGERDDTVPVVGAGLSAVKRNSTLLAPERKPVPPPQERTLGGLPFSPDSYDTINPHPAASLAALSPFKTLQEPQNSNIRSSGTKKGRFANNVVTNASKPVDPSDVLLPSTFAPEPEKRGKTPRPQAPPAPSDQRKKLIGRRSPSPLPPRNPGRLSLLAPESASVAPMRKEMSVVSSRDSRERERRGLTQKNPRALPASNAGSDPSARDRYSIGPGALVMYNPNSERERERAEMDSRALMPTSGHDNYRYSPEPPRYSGMEVEMYGRNRNSRSAAPPVPAKIPIEVHGGAGMSREEYLLSQEMSMINIGVGDGGRVRRSRPY
ncbi:hypothetical protein RUND412_005733 [Rhizina undulata]